LSPEETALEDEPGARRVIFGPNKGRTVISQSEWHDLPEGRAEKYVPEDELDPYSVDSGEGDLQLPQPTSDRDRLQEHAVFWKYVASEFAEQFATKIDRIYTRLEEADDVLDEFMEMEPEDLVIAPTDYE
jgi:hypothetical protein